MKKNLRKILAVVLVVVMALSIGAIGASATFTDASATKYGAAVDVLSGIGVINGMPNGTFDPTGSLTREQGAKIIAYMLLGPTNAAMIANATSQKFSDVAPDRWSAGYIEYCANLGIINGVGDGSFNPTGTLTTAAFTKMLLGALGYKADVEGLTGPSWAINTASLAVSAGVYDSGIAISGNTCTREQAAQLAYQALQATEVQYTGGSTITIGGSTITTGATRDFVANSSTTTITNDSYMQFAEQHFPNLVKSAAGLDDFGRPGTITWTNGSTVIATALPTPTKTYTTAVTGATIFADLGLTSNITATTYTDGKQNNNTFGVNYNSTTTIGGNGAETEVYYDSTAGTITIVVINTYFGSVSAVTAATAASPANVTVTAGNEVVGSFASGTYNTAGFAVNDPVIYTVAQTGAATYVVESVAAPTKATVTASSYVANTSFVAGGTAYNYSAKLDSSAIGDFIAHDVYFDSHGNVINVANATAAITNYAVVLAHGSGTDALGNAVPAVQLLFTDGTTKTVSTDQAYAALDGKIVTFAVNATTGLYSLTDASATAYTGNAIAFTNGVSAISYNSTVAAYGNANTLFLVRTGAGTTANPYVYTPYTGIANEPTLSGNATAQIYSDSGFARIVYVTGATVTGTSTASVYLTGTYTTTTDATLGTYYTANAIVNGQPTTVKLAAAPTAGLYTGITYNSNNIGTIGSAATSTTPAHAGTVAAANGVVGFGNSTDGYTYYSYSSDCAVYYISAVSGTDSTTGIGSVSSIKGVLTDANDTVTYTTNTSGLVNAIYIQVVA